MGRQYEYDFEEIFENGCGMDNCDKYKVEAMKQEEEAKRLKEIAEKIEHKAHCLDEEVKELKAKLRCLEAKEEELWTKYDKVSEAAFRLLCMANENLEKYIECKEDHKKPCPPRPCPPNPCRN